MAFVLIAIGAISLLVAIVIARTGPPYKYRLTQREADRRDLRSLAITSAFGVALLAGLLSSIASRKIADSQRALHHSQFWLSVGAIVGFLWWAIAHVAYNGVTRSVISPGNECLSNLRRLDQAKYAFSEEGQNPSLINQNSLTKYLDGNVLACPSGGKYTIGTIDESPTCSLHEWP